MPINNTHAMRQFSALQFLMCSAATCRIAVPAWQSLSSALKNSSQYAFTSRNCDALMLHSGQLPLSATVPCCVCLIANSRTFVSTLCRREMPTEAQKRSRTWCSGASGKQCIAITKSLTFVH